MLFELPIPVFAFLLLAGTSAYGQYVPQNFADLWERDHFEQSGNISCMAYATMLEYEPTEEAFTWCDHNLEHQRKGMCTCVDYINENNKRKRSMFKRAAEVSRDVASRFLETLFLLEAERGRRPKTTLQEECCYESCYVQEVYDHCNKHFEKGIYDRY